MADEITVAVATTDGEGNQAIKVATTRRSKGLATIENALSQGESVIASEDEDTVNILLEALGAEAGGEADEKSAARIKELEAEVKTAKAKAESDAEDLVAVTDELTQAKAQLAKKAK